ncbi:hypothetical protein C1646_675568 [Rhizophagus diaphanus]|nr:hypothetical protein C1646_675568 [Rhizophagus diaphanus] [Rhizophagus sp. MUCL 43196]
MPQRTCCSQKIYMAYRKILKIEYSDREIASSLKNIEDVREAKGAKYAKGTEGVGSAGSARGLRKSKRVLDCFATYCTKKEEEKDEKEEEEEESQQLTQQSTIFTSSIQQTQKILISVQKYLAIHMPQCSKFFPSKMWPNFEEYKASMEKWLNSNHANYLKAIGNRKWVNAFTRNFYAKMKDIRGSHASAVQTAIFRNFGLQLTISKKDSTNDIIREAIAIIRKEDNTSISLILTSFIPKSSSAPKWIPLFEPDNILRLTGKFIFEEEPPHGILQIVNYAAFARFNTFVLFLQ